MLESSGKSWSGVNLWHWQLLPAILDTFMVLLKRPSHYETQFCHMISTILHKKSTQFVCRISLSQLQLQPYEIWRHASAARTFGQHNTQYGYMTMHHTWHTTHTHTHRMRSVYRTNTYMDSVNSREEAVFFVRCCCCRTGYQLLRTLCMSLCVGDGFRGDRRRRVVAACLRGKNLSSKKSDDISGDRTAGVHGACIWSVHELVIQTEYRWRCAVSHCDVLLIWTRMKRSLCVLRLLARDACGVKKCITEGTFVLVSCDCWICVCFGVLIARSKAGASESLCTHTLWLNRGKIRLHSLLKNAHGKNRVVVVVYAFNWACKPKIRFTCSTIHNKKPRAAAAAPYKQMLCGVLFVCVL